MNQRALWYEQWTHGYQILPNSLPFRNLASAQCFEYSSDTIPPFCPTWLVQPE